MTGFADVKMRFARLAFLARKGAAQFLRYGALPRGASQHVFVAGVQRSGTNMVMDVLEQSIESVVYHERDPRAFDDYLMRDRATIHRLARTSRAPCFVIKALCESQEIRQLLDDFPPAKGLWVFRHYNDVVNSMLRSFKEHAIHIRRIANDRDSAGWRGRGMSDATHEIVRRFARPELTNENAAALMWYLRNDLYFELKLPEDPRVLLIQYEPLVTHPEAEFRRVYRFIRLDYSEMVARSVTSGSVSKQPAPALDAPIDSLCREMHDRLIKEYAKKRGANWSDQTLIATTEAR